MENMKPRYTEIHWILKSTLQLSTRANVKIDECVLDWKILSCQCQYCHYTTIAVIATHEKPWAYVTVTCLYLLLAFSKRLQAVDRKGMKRFFFETIDFHWCFSNHLRSMRRRSRLYSQRKWLACAWNTLYIYSSLGVFSYCNVFFLIPSCTMLRHASVILKFCQHTEVPTSGGACSLVPWEYRRYRYCCDSVLPHASCLVR